MKINFKAYLIILILFLSSNISSKSHYSLEHAEKLKESGKIKWREYGPHPFLEAKKFNKPVFLLLTAPSWCYRCHVYSSEDYLYHPLIFSYINEKFIPIFVDADKRQDLTRQYLEGGWPSTTVMTPAGERLFGFSGPRPVAFMLENMKKAVGFVNRGSFKSSIFYDYKKVEPVIPVKKKLDIFLFSGPCF